jgi:hemoglobin-like flavoprotein
MCLIMTPEQIDLVRKSFDALWPFRRKLAAQFYGRFFELAPDARRLFTSDMDKQQLKLMDAIAAIVGALDQREMFQSIISHTGRKHAEFGVREADFVAFGDALLWGLQQQLGPGFSPELKQAWTVLYGLTRFRDHRLGLRTPPVPRAPAALHLRHWPTESATHFFMWLFLAAPARFFDLESKSQAVLASFSHFVMKLLRAAPASFLSVASDLQVAKAGPDARHTARISASLFMVSSLATVVMLSARARVGRQAVLCCRLSGTLPPLSASLVITCLCSQMFISAEPSSAPL